MTTTSGTGIPALTSAGTSGTPTAGTPTAGGAVTNGTHS